MAVISRVSCCREDVAVINWPADELFFSRDSTEAADFEAEKSFFPVDDDPFGFGPALDDAGLGGTDDDDDEIAVLDIRAVLDCCGDWNSFEGGGFAAVACAGSLFVADEEAEGALSPVICFLDDDHGI